MSTLYTDMPQSERDTLIAGDLLARAEVIAEALQVAFGGMSQLSPLDVGRAVAGQIRNNGLTVHGTVRDVCGAVCDALDPDWADAAFLEAVVLACGEHSIPVSPYVRPRGGY